MRPIAFSQLMLILMVSYIFALVVMDKSIPPVFLLVLGVLCPSPLQASAGSVLGPIAGATKASGSNANH